MAGFTSLDQVIAALNDAKRRSFHKAAVTTKGAGFHHSLWKADGMPRAGSNPATGNGAIPDDETTGAIKIANAASLKNNVLYGLGLHGTKGFYILYDRLFNNSGLVGNVTTLQSFTQPALTRQTSGQGVELWGEVYTALGATATVITAIYTNQSGTGSRTATYSTAEGGTPTPAGFMFPFKLQAGDTGVQSVQSVQLSVSTGTAGDWGITLVKRIGGVNADTDGVRREYQFLTNGLPVFEDDACLSLMLLATTASHGALYGDWIVLEAPE